jgi:hypothetical protein
MLANWVAIQQHLSTEHEHQFKVHIRGKINRDSRITGRICSCMVFEVHDGPHIARDSKHCASPVTLAMPSLSQRHSNPWQSKLMQP